MLVGPVQQRVADSFGEARCHCEASVQGVLSRGLNAASHAQHLVHESGRSPSLRTSNEDCHRLRMLYDSSLALFSRDREVLQHRIVEKYAPATGTVATGHHHLKVAQQSHAA